MASPFPGMDPYLERHWRDVHATMIVHLRGAIQTRLPAGLRARIEERVFIEGDDPGRSVYPDVRVVESPRASAATEKAQSGQEAGASPLLVHLENEPVTETCIEIVDSSTGNRLVSSIEILSPSNKLAGAGRDLYLQKRREMRAGKVNVVEIDLIRAGPGVLLVPQDSLPRRHRGRPYQVCVWRPVRPSMAEVYPISLQDRLPTIGVPLREPDPDLPVDLQPIVARAYEDGGFDDIDYSRPPEPALGPADEAWTDALLRRAGRRQ